MTSRLTVIKVGGSLLTNGADLGRAAAAVAERRRQGETLLVVVSAFQGVTDLLVQAACNGERRHRLLARLHRLHEGMARELDGDTPSRIRLLLLDVEEILASTASGRLPEKLYARLLSAGERLSVPLMAAALRAQGVAARAMTSEELELRAVGATSDGRCDLAASAEGLRKVRPVLDERVVVLTGFYGVDRDGGVVLFGRGGSDDTAGAVAAGLEADRLELWKDVGGLMTADPRHVKQARVVPELSFDEVAQLGFYGSRIVHHGSLEPLRGKPTEIRVCPIGDADGDGDIGAGGNGSNGSGANGHGTRILDARAAGASRRNGARVAVLTARWSPPLVAMVGDGVAGEAAISARMLECLAGARVRGPSRVEGSGHAGLSCAVHRDDLVPALNGLHEQFFDGSVSGA